MIEYLEKLVQEREWQKGAAYAESLLVNPDNTPLDMVKIHRLLGTCRLSLGEYQGAISAGRTATSLAKELQAWDDFGVACLDLGFAFVTIQQLDDAVYWWFEYLSQLGRYSEAARLETSVRFNLGIYYSRRGDFKQACEMLFKALESGRRLGDARLTHGVRQALIEAYLRVGNLDSIPRLLAQSAGYLRHNPGAVDYLDSCLFLLNMRSEFAFMTRRYVRARLLAVAGLVKSAGSVRHEYTFHMLLAAISQEEKNTVEALGHLLTARSLAQQAKRYDLESAALELVYRLESDCERAEQLVDAFYTTMELV